MTIGLTVCTLLSNTSTHVLVLICADDIISSILPESVDDEIPTGFSVVGHIGESETS